MKYWRGYIVAVVLGFFTWALMRFAEGHTLLIDRVYPYVTRMVQSWLAAWTSSTDLCLWQVVLVLLILGALAGFVVLLVMRGSLVQYVGWVLACASLLFFLHTGIYGLNKYAGPLSDDLRMKVTEFTEGELEEATIYYRDKANALADQIARDPAGNPQYSEFAVLAEQAGEGFEKLVYERSFSVFAGSYIPVKELGWSDTFLSLEIDGLTMPLTGEAAVSPDIPVVSLPFVICREMAHRMSIALEQDANFAAFLACDANTSPEFRYSAYFMAYRFCYDALAALGNVEAAQRVSLGVNDQLRRDLSAYNAFFTQNRNESATQMVTTVNNAYDQVSGEGEAEKPEGDVSQLLVCWYIQEIVLPQQEEDEVKFDPYDEDWVFPPETTPVTESGNNG